MRLFKELKSVFTLENKTSFLSFLIEILVFLIIASFSAFLISFPIFYLGTSYSGFYKLSGSFLVVFSFFVLFIYRILSVFRRQEKGISNNPLEDNVLRFIYSFPYIFPLWFRSLSIFLFIFIFISLIVTAFLKGISYLSLSFAYLDFLDLGSLSLWVDKLSGMIYLFISERYLFVFLLFSVLLFIIVLFSSKSIIQRYSYKFLIWFLFIFELSIFLFIFYIFIFVMYHILF